MKLICCIIMDEENLPGNLANEHAAVRQIEHEADLIEAEMKHRKSQKITAATVASDIELVKVKSEEASPWKSVLCALIICLGSFAFGTAIGYPSPATPNLNDNVNTFHVTDEQNSWIGSILTLGALVGGLIGGPIMDVIGRKTSIIVWGLPFAIGWTLVLSAPNFGCMLAGRIICGLCTGIYSVTCPVYIGEIAPPSIRGLLGSCHQMAVCLGILFVYGFGAFLNWQWLGIACEAVNIVLVVLVAFIPESPRWLLSVERREETIDALHWLRGDDYDITKEMLELEKVLKESMDKASMKEFLQPHLYKPLGISLGLMVFQQFSGINVIMFYTVQIFEMADIPMDPNMQTIIVGAVGVVGTLVSVFISDLAGRRILLMISGCLMTLSMAGMGAFFYESDTRHDDDLAKSLAWLPVTCLVVFNFGFNVAFGPIPWVMMSELFPLRAKAVASSIATAANWLCAFLLTKFWVNMTDTMTVAGGYWFCMAFCALSMPFAFFIVPETKGIPLEEIVAKFQ